MESLVTAAWLFVGFIAYLLTAALVYDVLVKDWGDRK